MVSISMFSSPGTRTLHYQNKSGIELFEVWYSLARKQHTCTGTVFWTEGNRNVPTWSKRRYLTYWVCVCCDGLGANGHQSLPLIRFTHLLLIYMNEHNICFCNWTNVNDSSGYIRIMFGTVVHTTMVAQCNKLDFWPNSPKQHVTKWVNNSMEILIRGENYFWLRV